MSNRPTSHIAPLAIRARIAKPQSQGLPLINMALNESPYAPSDDVRAAIVDQSLELSRYGAPKCNVLVEGLVETYDVPENTLICGNGSEELLEVIARSFVQAGDEIVMSQYGYIVFEMIAKRLKARLIKAPELHFTSDVDALLAAISPATRLIFLANPNNPTATALDENDLIRLAKEIPPNVVLVIDLAYGEFVGFDYCSRVHAFAQQHENVVVTRTFSKAFALAGLRVGWAQAPAWMLPILYSVRGMGTVNAVAQAAASISLRNLDRVRQHAGLIVSERARMVRALEEIGVHCIPGCANFILMTLHSTPVRIIENLVEFIFDASGILVTLAREEGLQNYVRVSVSLPENNDKFIESVQLFIKEAPSINS